MIDSYWYLKGVLNGITKSKMDPVKDCNILLAISSAT